MCLSSKLYAIGILSFLQLFPQSFKIMSFCYCNMVDRLYNEDMEVNKVFGNEVCDE